jgi:hypothetical protein
VLDEWVMLTGHVDGFVNLTSEIGVNDTQLSILPTWCPCSSFGPKHVQDWRQEEVAYFPALPLELRPPVFDSDIRVEYGVHTGHQKVVV